MDKGTRRGALKPTAAAAQEGKSLKDIKPSDIEANFSKRAADMHRKIDETRSAYFGFIFPIPPDDFKTVAHAMGMNDRVTSALHKRARALSTFRLRGARGGQVTNHILGTSILALRGKSLDTGLQSVSDKNLAEIVSRNKTLVSKIAAARASWFGRIFFPAAAFSNAIAVFGGKVSADAIYALAEKYRFAAKAGKRKTVRGDFGIGVWLTLLARA